MIKINAALLQTAAATVEISYNDESPNVFKIHALTIQIIIYSIIKIFTLTFAAI
jgi:hypothetical protein